MSDVDPLLDEVRLLWHRLVELGQGLHARESVSLGMRAVLEFLLVQGSATVPSIARSRGVTRQHIQALVNELLPRRLVALAPNPAHRRSPLVTLSRSGERAIRRMRAREEALLGKTRFGVSPSAMAQAAGTLRRVRAALARGRRSGR
jgi:DNA-binding MarR family transcriptional regulator